jgi:hypothetical protein
MVYDDEMRAFGGPSRSKEKTLAALVEDARTRVTGAFFFGDLAPEYLFASS